MAWAAPLALASAHFSSDPAVPISCSPSAFAHWQAIRPTPPAAAWNRIASPGARPSTGSVRRSRYSTVRPYNIIAAPVSKSISSGSLQTCVALSTRTSQ